MKGKFLRLIACWLVLVICLSFSLPAQAQLFPGMSGGLPDVSALGGGGSRGGNVGASINREVVMESTMYIPGGVMPNDYRLGPGDQFEAHLVMGKDEINLDYNFVINPEGKIYFHNVGVVSLNDLTLLQAKLAISREIKTKFSYPFELTLLITQPKKVKIYVTGQVANPGLATIYDGTRISEVVKQVGVANGGSKRDVNIRRGEKVLKVDLYAVLYLAQTDKDLAVRMGDVIEVPPLGGTRINVMGEVPRPGQYELHDGEKLKDALAMAGYLNVNSIQTGVAYLKRAKDGGDFDNYKIDINGLFDNSSNQQNILLSDGDIISVPGIQTFVYVYGQVGMPGRVVFIPGQKLSDYLNKTGGPKPNASLGSVTITRQEPSGSKVYSVDAADILMRGKLNKDMEIYGGDVINVPANFFYFADFGSLANTVLLAVTLYSTVARK